MSNPAHPNAQNGMEPQGNTSTESTANATTGKSLLEEQLAELRAYHESGKNITTPRIQRLLKLGYNRASLLFAEWNDRLRKEEAAFTGDAVEQGTKEGRSVEPPEILITTIQPDCGGAPHRDGDHTSMGQLCLTQDGRSSGQLATGKTSKTPKITRPAVEVAVPELVSIASLIQRAPFSTLLRVDAATQAAIQNDMECNGCDPNHPIHVWVAGDLFILIDGFTRVMAAVSLGIELLPAFLHRFKTEDDALDFAIRCQVNRRNITDAELLGLIKIYDEKIKPGTNQGRENGRFSPKASSDAVGKTAAATADALGTSTTKIERARRVIEKGSPLMLKKVTDGKLTINAAITQIAKGDKESKLAPTKGKKADDGYEPFTQNAETEVTFATWNPLLVTAQPSSKPDNGVETVAYSIPDGQLDLGFKKAALKKIAAQFGHRRVLVSSNTDLFDTAVPVSLVRQILNAAQAAPEFEFLFTTRNPGRLAEFPWAKNTFAGATISEARDVTGAEGALAKIKAMRKWMLIDQLTMELRFKHLSEIDWIVVRSPSAMPKGAAAPEAMRGLLQCAWASNCPVFFGQEVSYRPVDPPKGLKLPDLAEKPEKQNE